MPLLRLRLPARSAIAVTAAAMLCTGTAVPAAWAAPQTDRSRDCDTSGVSQSYVVVFDEDTSRGDARRSIRRACGETITFYAPIDVAVASSPDPGFDEHIGVDRAFSARAHLATDGPDPHRIEVARTDASAVDDADRAGEQWSMNMINATAARADTGRAPVTVGVLDSGIDPAHPDLADAVDPALSVGCLSGKPDRSRRAWTPSTSVHGTHTAGIIAAADDRSGVVGVAPGVRLASIKVIDDRGQVDPAAAVCGLMWAGKHGIDITNSSFYVNTGAGPCGSDDEHGVVREAVTRAAEFASERGTLHVAAVTNDGVALSPSTGAATDCEVLPAGVPSVLAVSAVDSDGLKSSYSAYGLGVVSIAAPGGDDGGCVLSTAPDGYSDLCGTSMAAPHVAGTAALLATHDADATPADLRETLHSTARETACPTDYDRAGDGRQDAFCTGYREFNSFYGHGVVDARAAVEAATAEPPDPVPDAPPEEADAAPAEPSPTDPQRATATEEAASDKSDDQDQQRERRPHPVESTVGELTKHLDAAIQRR